MEAALGPLASLHACHRCAAVTLTILTDADRLKQAPERAPTPNTQRDTSSLSAVEYLHRLKKIHPPLPGNYTPPV